MHTQTGNTVVAIAERSGLGAIVRALFPLLTRRSCRVVLLGLVIARMSAIDLYLTLLYLTHLGMNEMNPLARALIEYQSPMLLALWKTATVVLSVGILLLIRKQRSAEIGAWIGCLVLAWLMGRWVGFIDETSTYNIEILHEIARGDPDWVAMPAPGARGDVGAMVID